MEQKLPSGSKSILFVLKVVFRYKIIGVLFQLAERSYARMT